MEERKPITNVAAGLILAGIMIAVSLLITFSGSIDSSIAQWASFIIIVGGVIFFVNLYGKAIDYNSTFGNYFAYGFKITAVLTIIVLVFTVVFTLAFPEYREQALELARQKLEDQGKLTDDQIDSSIEMVRNNYWTIAIGGSILSNLILGAIGSLLGAAITKKRPRTPFDQPAT